MIIIKKNNSECSGEIALPPSKSISNRLLLIQFLCGRRIVISNLSHSDDTLLLSSLLDILRQYRFRNEQGLLRMDTKNAGTVMRFLIPLLAVTRGHYLLTGSDRMKERPVSALVEALRDRGADIEYLEEPGFLPLLIRGRALDIRRITLDASLSSQFITAFLLLAPTLEEGLALEITGQPVSRPYVRMTTAILEELGIQVIVQDNTFKVFPGRELKKEITVEPDWSAASFWYCMLCASGSGEIFFPGLKRTGVQGDQQVALLFRDLGIETMDETGGIRIRKSGIKSGNFHADFTDFPDLALPVILACGMEGIPGTFAGLERLRVKESDRLEALEHGLHACGLKLGEEAPGLWRLSGALTDPCPVRIDDYNDHRVAMTFACLAAKKYTVSLDHPDVVNKSYPGFWDDLQSAGFIVNTSC